MPAGPVYIYKFLFITVTRLSRIFLRIVKRSSIHKLQLGFVNISIEPIRSDLSP